MVACITKRFVLRPSPMPKEDTLSHLRVVDVSDSGESINIHIKRQEEPQPSEVGGIFATTIQSMPTSFLVPTSPNCCSMLSQTFCPLWTTARYLATSYQRHSTLTHGFHSLPELSCSMISHMAAKCQNLTERH